MILGLFVMYIGPMAVMAIACRLSAGDYWLVYRHMLIVVYLPGAWGQNEITNADLEGREPAEIAYLARAFGWPGAIAQNFEENL